MSDRIITLVGGTGFVGRYAVKLLAKAGYTLRVVSRHPSGALQLKTAGEVGQVVLVPGNITRPDTLHKLLAPSYAIINLVGVLYESGRNNFAAIHAKGAENLAKAAAAVGAKKFIHISALGVDKAVTSTYAKTKLRGEEVVRTAFPQATILRPSVIFGAEDNFLNKFAAMATMSPVLPLIGGGRTKFQPVYVGDVARAIVQAVKSDTCQGKTYELAGPHVYSFKEILELILADTHRNRKLLTLPFPLASLLGSVLQFLPGAPLTADQVRLLHYDNILTSSANGFAELGIAPTALEAIAPSYLQRYHYIPAQ